ncbi:YifB family Mg chelatase-like AAA ATPase [Zhenpiania hominis]|uniref:YifB family Mg chelatase-like AAA ATPase n=1 Tax=Zhenpiania hominis TaxID=2763644 RepID=UPI0039F4F5FF
MLSKIITASLLGMDAEVITVETDLQPGLPAVHMVGLVDTTIKEARERIRAAILNSGLEFPRRRITVNLSPAGRPKEGSHFDLPIAMGILMLERHAEPMIEKTAFLGELSLDGQVKPIRGALPLAMGLRQQGIRRLVLPENNLREVALLKDMRLYPVRTLAESLAYARGKKQKNWVTMQAENDCEVDSAREEFRDVAGQERVKRAALVAAAGNHGIFMIGSPGSGKTMIAKRIPSIMPEMSYEERLEVTRVYSAAGLLDDRCQVVRSRPFRAPHHSISKAAFIGGGRIPGPGELSLAHNGILFLDEFGEFDPALLETLRQPVEKGTITINRSWGSVSFPCRVMLVAASNPCRCGYYGDQNHLCTCSERELARYYSRFSGPLLDRFDLHIQVLPVPRSQITSGGKGEDSYSMRQKVAVAAEIQTERYKDAGIRFNSRLTEKQTEAFCPMTEESRRFLQKAYETLGLSMRAYYKMIKVSRTIADLEQEPLIHTAHIAEALQYRQLEPFYRRMEYDRSRSIYK